MSSILAYFDPGPGSLLLQAIVGGSAGLIVFGKLLWESASQRIRNRNGQTLSRDSISAESSGEIPIEAPP